MDILKKNIKPGPVQKGIITLACLCFAGFGIYLMVGIIKETAQIMQTRRWAQTPCTIEKSEIIASAEAFKSSPYELAISYSYEAGGVVRTGSSVYIKRNDSLFSDYAQAYQILEQYPVGQKAACFVNPKDASKAVLGHTHPTVFYLIFIPLIITVLSGWSAYLYAFRDDAWRDEAVTAKKKTKGSVGPVLIYCSLIGFCFLIKPFYHSLSASRWTQTPCSVLMSQTRMSNTRGTEDGQLSHRVDIVYEYQVDGHVYKSNQYGFMNIRSYFGRESRIKTIKDHPVGKTTVCWVNPSNPRQSVLSRSIQPMLYVSLIPLTVLLIGIFLVLRKSRKTESTEETPDSAG